MISPNTKHEPLAKGRKMNATTKYTGERNGYGLTVYEYVVKGKRWYSSRVKNLTTQSSAQTPGFSSYAVALQAAQDEADEGKIK